MMICGIELKSNNAILSLIDTESKLKYVPIKQKKLTLSDDESIGDIENFLNEIKNLIKWYDIDTIVIKKRAKKGNFAGGAVTFKLETIFQLNGICDTRLLSAQSISNFEKKNEVLYPESLNKYQEQSYLTALAYFDSVM